MTTFTRWLAPLFLLLCLSACDYDPATHGKENSDFFCKFYKNCTKYKYQTAQCSLWGGCAGSGKQSKCNTVWGCKDDKDDDDDCGVWGCADDKGDDCGVWGCADEKKEDDCGVWGCSDKKEKSSNCSFYGNC